jgi:lipoate-protein ligase A
MRAVKPARYIPYQSLHCYDNMAIDEYLASWCEKSGKAALRIYGWTPPAVSLGRNQKADSINTDFCMRQGIALVRRITGGGAIYHDAELTYCIASSRHDLEGGSSIPDSYRLLNRCIIDTFSELGLEAAYAGEAVTGLKFGERAPSCFEGLEELDIVIGGKKIGGNAQRRERETILQHGSIPIRIDSGILDKIFYEPAKGNGFSCLEEILSRPVSIEEVSDHFIASAVKNLELSLEEEPITSEEMKIIGTLVIDKYRQDRWNFEGILPYAEDEETCMAQQED